MARDTGSTTHRDATAPGRTGWTPGQAGFPTPGRDPRWTTGGLVAAVLVPVLVVLAAFAPLLTVATTVAALTLVGLRYGLDDDSGPPG